MSRVQRVSSVGVMDVSSLTGISMGAVLLVVAAAVAGVGLVVLGLVVVVFLFLFL